MRVRKDNAVIPSYTHPCSSRTMLAIQLPAEYEIKLEQLAQREQRPALDIIRQALDRYFAEAPHQATPYELGADLFGQCGSGSNNLSTDYKRLIKEKLHAKHAH